MTQHAASMHDLRLVADRPSLNFANTIDPRQGSRAIDYLQTYKDLVVWGVRAGIVSRATASRLMRLARRNKAKADQALETARQLRESIYRVFSGLAVHRYTSASDLALLSTAFHEASGRARLEQHGRAFRWRLDNDLELIGWKVARDAVLLLESGPLDRVKRCPGNEDCGWVFLDTSKNSSRRWCSMAGCGNRAKARRHARRSDSNESSRDRKRVSNPYVVRQVQGV
jgi:predicted RNA-binding Zn ribbon-like protein